ncbi:MAG: FAD-binding oxidoreductase [Chloroflexota bacterium]
MTSHPEPFDLDRLRGRVRVRVVTPADADYDAARAVMYGPDRRPIAIVQVVDAADVAAAVDAARDAGLELAVRAGGHSAAGHGTTDGGLVIDLRGLRSLEIDPVGRTARAGAGLTAGEVGQAAAEHGLAIGFGDTASVGIGGLTTGGGVGYLVRKHGLTIDNLLSAEIVTADGAIREVDADHEPELFWAIRGGGGNFGVATRFTYRLADVPGVVGGMLLLPATAEVLAGFIAAAEAAPDELSAIANVMPAMPLPFIPAEAHGKLAIMALMAYAGDTEAGLAALAPFRALATPIADLLRPMRYPELFPPTGGPGGEGPAPQSYGRNVFLDTADRDLAADIVERIAAHATAPGTLLSAVQLRVLGGAYARVPAEATAYAHRGRRIMANVGAVYLPAADPAVQRAWVDATADAIRQGRDDAYVNFLPDAGEAGVREAYPEPTLARLRAIKQAVDPGNLFRRNHNIAPSG